MAFCLGLYSDVPSTLSGKYLLPLRWLHYGITNNLLKVGVGFYDSLQGSIYLDYVSHIEEGNRITVVNGRCAEWSSDPNIDLTDELDFFVYDGRGMYHPIPRERRKVKNGPDGYVPYLIDDEHYRMELRLATLEQMEDMSPAEQHTVNNSLIQLLRGCHVTLLHKVWFL